MLLTLLFFFPLLFSNLAFLGLALLLYCFRMQASSTWCRGGALGRSSIVYIAVSPAACRVPSLLQSYLCLIQRCFQVWVSSLLHDLQKISELGLQVDGKLECYLCGCFEMLNFQVLALTSVSFPVYLSLFLITTHTFGHNPLFWLYLCNCLMLALAEQVYNRSSQIWLCLLKLNFSLYIHKTWNCSLPYFSDLLY